MTEVRICVEEVAARNGKFAATVEGRALCTSSRQPFLDAARVLLAEGADPATRIVMCRASGEESLRSTIGAAAKLMVAEGERYPPKLVRWRAFPSDAIRPPMR